MYAVVLEKDDINGEVSLDQVVPVTLAETPESVEIPFAVAEDVPAKFSITLDILTKINL